MSEAASTAVPLVAAVVVAWRSEATLRRCLDALSKQTVPFSRVVLIDNTENASQHSPEWSGKGQLLFEGDGRNTGFAAANNHGVALCPDCDWIALVNPDAFLEPEWLERMLEAVVRRPDAAAFGSRLLQAGNPDMLDGVGDVMHVSGLTWRAGHGRAAMADMGTGIREIFSPCAAAALYRRSAFGEVGGFDERFFCYVEDVDLGFRLRLAGYRCWYVPGAIAMHVGSASSGGKRSAFAVYHGHRNLVWCYVKNMPAFLLWAGVPLHLLANLCSLILFAARGMGREIFRAKRDAMRGIPGMWRSRRTIVRKAPVKDMWRILDKRLLPRR